MTPERHCCRIMALVVCLVTTQTWSQQTTPPPNPTTIIHAGGVLADPGKQPLGPQTIIVREGRIVAMHAGFDLAGSNSDKMRIIDLSDRFVMPGLIDAHMHLAIDMHAEATITSSEARMALAVAAYSRQLLNAGVTTVRDVGDNTRVTLAVRDAIADGELAGPRIIAAGRLISRTGGHGATMPEPGDFAYVPATCDGVESCRRVVRENIEQGSDWIKVTVSGSGRETAGKPDAPPILFEDEFSAISQAAHQAGRPVAAHAHSTAAINLALKYGARTIEHGTYFDDESVKLFKQQQAFLVPTAFVAEFVASQAGMFAGGREGESQEELLAWAKAAMAVPGRAWRAGIVLGLGTDGGPSFDTTATAHEVELYVSSGVPTSEAIKAATANNAAVLGLSAELGHIQPGYRADLIAVADDPYKTPATLRSPVFVMKDGVVYRDSRNPLPAK